MYSNILEFVWIFHHLKITVSQLLETIDRCNLFHLIIGIVVIVVILYFSYLSLIIYHLYLLFVTGSSYFEQQSLQPKFLPTANKLHQLGFTLYATEATAQYLNEHNIPAEPVEWPLHSVGVNPTATRYETRLAGHFNSQVSANKVTFLKTGHPHQTSRRQKLTPTQHLVSSHNKTFTQN